MEGCFDRLILVPGTGFEPARVRTHPIAPKAIASTKFRHPGTVKLEAGLVTVRKRIRYQSPQFLVAV